MGNNININKNLYKINNKSVEELLSLIKDNGYIHKNMDIFDIYLTSNHVIFCANNDIYLASVNGAHGYDLSEFLITNDIEYSEVKEVKEKHLFKKEGKLLMLSAFNLVVTIILLIINFMYSSPLLSIAITGIMIALWYVSYKIEVILKNELED